jgi:integrase
MSPKKLKPHLHHEIDRLKRPFWCVRIGHGRRIRLRSEFGSAAFWGEYDAALLALDRPRQRAGHAHGTFAHALASYRKSIAWQSLALKTRSQRNSSVFNPIEAKLGKSRLVDWKPADIAAGRDARKPSVAKAYLAALRGLFRWALENGLIRSDPTAGLRVRLPASDGHAPWTEAEVAAYRARWPLGTRQRLALELLLQTGLRIGDAVRVGPSDVVAGVMRLATEKTGERVSLAISEALAEAIEAGPVGTSTFITGPSGGAITKHTGGLWISTWAKEAGVIGKSAHGLRKAAAIEMAHAGWTERELESFFGWRGGGMASLYTQAADRERLSLQATARTRKGLGVPN